MAKTNISGRSFSHNFTRRDFLSTSLKAGAAAAFTTSLLPNLRAETAGRYNVLFITIDDLRPLLACYGHSEMHTPNIDALAERGTLFNRAYCQFPVCNPSRASMLTGLRPETIGVLNNFTNFRQTSPEAVTLPQHFKTHGYHTRSIGKIFHKGTFDDDDLSWSVPTWRPKWQPYESNENTPSWQAFDVSDDELMDGKIARHTTQVLEEIRNVQFFLAVGFHRPHLPFYAPTQYYDLYDTQIFENVPDVTISPWHELQAYSDISSEDFRLPKEKTVELIRAYAASISYIDAQVGRVLNQLHTLGLTENTVIIFAGDHGFHLGENSIFGKRTSFEVSLRAPLIVSLPRQSTPSVRTDALVELVDIFPTLCDACQLPIPPELEGLSLVPVIEEPTRLWKTAAFSQIDIAHSIRTEQYRYTEWGVNAWIGSSLYDHHVDPDENINIAKLPENEELVANLSVQLRTGWQAALPDIQEQTHIPQTLPWDINNDGIVDIHDLLLVSNSFDTDDPMYPKADVNKDGSIDIIDLLLVAAHFGESSNPTAPPTITPLLPEQTAFLDAWLTQARLADDGSDLFQKGIATLEHLINTAMPTETVLLPNYPNPFNPETWIPYDLAEDADVHIHIYTLKGESIRRLSLGFQTSGTYRSQTRAAYWDGRNAVGETVASGIYFYTLQAGKFKSTRQMVILK